MAWVQLFPLGSTQINQSVQQIQDNWLFLQNNINTDHFFNDTVTPVNEGHHRFVQMLDAGDHAVAAGMSGVEYTKATPVGIQQPYFRSATTNQINQMVVAYRDQQNMGNGAVNFPLFNMAGLPQFSGFFIIYQVGGAGASTNQGSGIIVWDGLNAKVTQTSVRQSVTGVGDDFGTRITLSQNIAGLTTWGLRIFQIIN